jgi:hypothetical protein
VTGSYVMDGVIESISAGPTGRMALLTISRKVGVVGQTWADCGCERVSGLRKEKQYRQFYAYERTLPLTTRRNFYDDMDVPIFRQVREDVRQFIHRYQFFIEDESLRLEFLFDILVYKEGGLPGREGR